MTEPSPSYVCDQTIIMRVRLLCGLYSKSAVPPRWRPLAQAYCFSVPVAISTFLYSTRNMNLGLSFVLLLPSYGVYYLFVLISLWTGDEYLYKFFTLNKLTDITLDASRVFNRLQKQISRAYMCVFLFYTGNICVFIVSNYDNMFILLTLIFPIVVCDMFQTIGNSTKLLVMALVDARLLVLKRRLQRYGFRSTGYARSQDYCEVYHQTMQGLDGTDCPLKLLLFLDWFSSCCKIIYIHLTFPLKLQWTGHASIQMMAYVIASVFVLMSSFGHVVLLESAASHCDDMAVFSATQLIKTPTAEERRRIHSFLEVLEQRGARYHVLRALPLNARLVLGALNFCSAQVILLIDATKH